MKLISNIPYTTPVIGHIRIGGVVQANGTDVPYMNDFFTVTESFKKNGQWQLHALNQELVEKLPSKANGRLAEIPIKVVYANPDLNTMERLEAYDKETNRLVCAGDGQRAKRINGTGKIEEVPCPTSSYCEFGQANGCTPVCRSIFKIDGQNDELGAFVLRSNGFNAFTTLRTRFEQLFAKFGDLIRHLPLKLVLRTKSSIHSDDSLFYYPDIVINGDDFVVAEIAKIQLSREKHLGINHQELEKVMLELRNNGAFQLSIDDMSEFQEVQIGVAQQQKSNTHRSQSSGFQMRLAQPIEMELKPHSELAAHETTASESLRNSTGDNEQKKDSKTETSVEKTESKPKKLVLIESSKSQEKPKRRGKGNDINLGSPTLN